MIKATLKLYNLFAVPKLIVSLLVLSAFVQFAHADAAPLCSVDGNRISSFIRTAGEVQKVLNIICEDEERKFSVAELDRITKPALDMARSEAFQHLGEYSKDVTLWFGSIMYDDNPDPYERNIVFPKRGYRKLQGNALWFFSVDGKPIGEMDQADISNCDNKYKNCEGKLDALQYLMTLLGARFPSLKIGEFLEYVDGLDKDWDRFAEEARYQTFTDIWLTTKFYEAKEDFDHSLQGPPETQWFTMHPFIIIENVGAALDGSESEEAIALEVIGVNRWKDEKYCLGLPCGVSAIVTYADRAGISEDVGWGLMFHVDNTYSFGVTKYSGDVGIFFTLDLLNLFESKKNKVRTFKASIKEKMNKS